MPFFTRRTARVEPDAVDQPRYIKCPYFVADINNPWRCVYDGSPVFRHKPDVRPDPWRKRP